MEKQKISLPENAQRELAPGEVYRPILGAEKNFKEVTVYSVAVGILMVILFSAAAAYLGLKVGQVFEAAIPIAIIAVGLTTALGKKDGLGQNVIIQSIGGCSGAVVAGAIFTLPAIYILGVEVNFWQMFLSSLLGGVLGILFLIPFRKYFVSEMHGKYPFPEATATTQVLVSGEGGGAGAKTLLTAGLIGGIGVCGRALCCSKYMSDFQSITTQAARCQDLSLNPQKLAGQCSKLKCCINYEASTYVDAQRQLPELRGPIELEDGPAWLMKTDILAGTMYFSYEQGSLSNLYPLPASRVREILAENRKGIKPASLQASGPAVKQTEFISAVGDDSITRFDEQKKRRNNRKKKDGRKNNNPGNNNNNNNNNRRRSGNGGGGQK